MEPRPPRGPSKGAGLGCRTGNAVSLRPLLALNDVEDDFFTFFETLVTIFLNRAEMDEHIIAFVAPEEAIGHLTLLEPLDCAFVLAHRIHLSLESNHHQ